MRRVQAVRDKDIDRAMSHIARDILSFDVINPLQYRGSDSLRKRAAEWFASFEGPIGFELQDLSVVTGGDVAFSHSLNRVSATKKVDRTSKCGGEQAFATAKLTAYGRSFMSIIRYLSTHRMAKRRLISSRSLRGGVTSCRMTRVRDAGF